MKIYPKDLMLNGGVTMASLLGSHPPLLPFLLLWDSTSGKANVFLQIAGDALLGSHHPGINRYFYREMW
jgi:hypothetical protein